MSNSSNTDEIHDIVKNLVFANLTLEQISKLPKWLLVNIEDNFVEAHKAIEDLLIKAELEQMKTILEHWKMPAPDTLTQQELAGRIKYKESQLTKNGDSDENRL